MTSSAALSPIIDKSDQTLLDEALSIYPTRVIAAQLQEAGDRTWSPVTLKQRRHAATPLTARERNALHRLLPAPPPHHPHYRFRFIDLFAGIGGLRYGFDAIGGQCVFTSEWNAHAVKTYKANWYQGPEHRFNRDIRDITLSQHPEVDEASARAHILAHIPQHDVLLAGFPCQPFSLAGVSKKNALGRAHGFACETQGTLFFDIVRILAARQPAIFVLENVKNLKSHDQGRTFRIIQQTLSDLGYRLADSPYDGADDPKIIDGRHFLPQHRERIVLVGFRQDLRLGENFSLRAIRQYFPPRRPTLRELLDDQVEEKYLLSPKLWHYLYQYARKHQAKGNGFGFGLVSPHDTAAVTRTLSARYYKDGAEILIDRGWDHALGEQNFYHPVNMQRRPRRLTPRECARLMGFDRPGETRFRIPVSDTQAWRQFGNSVVVPVFAAVARLLEPWILEAVRLRQQATAPVEEN